MSKTKLTEEAKEAKRLRSKEYRKNNKEKIKAYNDSKREETREYKKKYRAEHPDKVKKGIQDWCNKNKEYIKIKRKQYVKDHAEKIKEDRKKYKGKYQKKVSARRKEKYQTDVAFRLKNILRARLNAALKNNPKKGHTLELLGCSIEELRAYLESQFQPGMTWENHGSYWEIDHIFPLAKADLQDPEQLAKVCHYSNLQPLTKEDNRSKKDSIPLDSPLPDELS